MQISADPSQHPPLPTASTHSKLEVLTAVSVAVLVFHQVLASVSNGPDLTL